jgi:hypothetical protein
MFEDISVSYQRLYQRYKSITVSRRFAQPLPKKLLSMTTVRSIKATTRGTVLKMPTPFSLQHRGDRGKDDGVSRHGDWTGYETDRSTCRHMQFHIVPCSPHREDAELGYQGSPRFDALHYKIHNEICASDISVVCPDILKKLM